MRSRLHHSDEHDLRGYGTPKKNGSISNGHHVKSPAQQPFALSSSHDQMGGPRSRTPLMGKQGGPNAPALPVKTYCRVRPFIDDEGNCVYGDYHIPRPVLEVERPQHMKELPNTLICLDPTAKFRPRRSQRFDSVFWAAPDGDGDNSPCPTCDQDDVFNTIGAEMSQQICEGYNSILVCAGFGPVGKTHTLFGDTGPLYSNSQENGVPRYEAGLLPRFAEDLFSRIIEVKPRNAETQVELECYELDDPHGRWSHETIYPPAL